MSDSQPIARLADVGKQYVKYEDVPTLVTGLLRVPGRSRRGRLWAIRHVDINVYPGEAVGVIGRNGAGKSTMLAILAGVTAPTEGVVSIRGRLAPLLRLGVGFHDELTGRENIYVNCMVLGMSRAEIDRAFDEIVAFAEIERFINTPVKFYSSGMQVRLGFASAVASKPDLLLVDEVLSVGDIGFQMKSFQKMQELRTEGATLVVVSHNIEAIRMTCERVVVLNEGSTVFNGPTNDAITAYHALLHTTVEDEADTHSKVVRILDFELCDLDGSPLTHVASGQDVIFRMHMRFGEDVVDPGFGLWIASEGGQMVYADNTLGTPTGTYAAGTQATSEVRVRLALATGAYIAGGGVRFGREASEQVAAPRRSFSVSGRAIVRGLVDLAGEFHVARSEQPTGADPAADEGS